MTKIYVYRKNIICPNLLGTSKGIMCKATGNYLKDMTDVDAHICRNGRYEGCFHYRFSLINVFMSKTESVRQAAV